MSDIIRRVLLRRVVEAARPLADAPYSQEGKFLRLFVYPSELAALKKALAALDKEDADRAR